MSEDCIEWRWRGQLIEVRFDTRGSGPTVLMLPALSSISTRGEMRAEQLASTFTTIAFDWPGFGDLPRPALRGIQTRIEHSSPSSWKQGRGHGPRSRRDTRLAI
jgi:hypothetical protein